MRFECPLTGPGAEIPGDLRALGIPVYSLGSEMRCGTVIEHITAHSTHESGEYRYHSGIVQMNQFELVLESTRARAY